jgi:3-ketosteroid 9alpha-monooxygenase subunit A
VCSEEDLKDGAVKSITALGTHMVAFRGQNGKVGVLHAFCPHLGAHLGEGGAVEGNLLVCPFHRWSFDVRGKCQKIPYMRSTSHDCDSPTVPDRARTKAYPVREVLGMILIWFHAEEEHADCPLYEPEVFDDLARGVGDGSYYYALMRNMEFDQHSCEMAMNSADQHHFDTLHAPFPIPVVEKFVTGVHKISVEYGKGIVNGQEVEREHLTLFKEKTQGLYFFGNKQYPVFLSEASSALVDTTVIFEGPTIVHFLIDTPFGRLRQVR